MELWIRSQDKRQLLKVNDGLFIANGFSETKDTFVGVKNVGHIGRYTTEGRALEVLNKIQETLMMCIKANCNEHLVGTSCYVYEMPKE